MKATLPEGRVEGMPADVEASRARTIVLVDYTRLFKDGRPAKVARTSGERWNSSP